MQTVNVVEIAQALNINRRNVLKRSLKESWPFEARPVRGGNMRFYPVDQLPPSVQIAIRDHYDSGRLPEGAETSPESAAQNESPCQALGLLSSGSGEDRLPDWQDAIARARVDLITLYDRAKNDAKAAGGKKAEGATRFIQAFNAGAHPDLQHILGKKKISRSTVESWAKTYAENGNDYRTLAPQWGQHLKKHHDLTPEEERQLFLILEQENRIKVSTAIHLTKVTLQDRGIESPSTPAAFKRAVEKHKKYAADVWTYIREGEKAFIDQVLPFIRRDDSKLEVGDVLVADGHRCNFTVINPFTGRDCRPTIIVFYDWKSRAMAGWAFAVEENTQVISAALRNAIIALGKLPKVVYMDNGKAFRARFFTKEVCDDLNKAGLHGLYQRLGIKCVFAKPYNARAKIVERFFREFGETFERFVPTYTGANIFDKPASMKRNEKLMQAINRRAPLEMHTVNRALTEWWFKFGAQRPHPTVKGATIAEVFEAGRGPGVDVAKLHFLMMEAQVKKLGRNGIRLMNADYWHESMFGLRCKVTVRYCLSDISKIVVHTEDGEYLCTAQRQSLLHGMACLGDAQDQAELNHRLGQINKLKKGVKDLVKRSHGLTGSSAEVTNSLQWDAINQNAPELVDEVARIEAEHEGARIAERTPVIDAADFKQLPASEPEPEAPKAEPTPIYYSEVDKFYALLQKDQLTFDEQEFFDAYKKTDMGKSIRAGEPDRAKGGNRV